MKQGSKKLEQLKETAIDIGWCIMGFFSALVIPFVWFPMDVWDWLRKQFGKAEG
ncbi:hypothetical protein [Pseudomonas putida]|uniref:hypothetical protein n=1 Tax=Pseudomonas putida TaxID=303 RepID=UPI001552DF99|nr:hypothetical protein [Pseudomonas putida]